MSCPFGISGTQQTADNAAGTVSEHKTKRLNNCHQSENDAHRAGGA